jgi:hypothetical protein
MFCQKCGSELKEKQTFCRICGEQIPNIKISIRKMSWVKRASSFSLGVIFALSFLLSIFFLMSKFGFHDSAAVLLLFILTLFSSGIIAVLLKEIKELKVKLEKETVDKEIKSFPEQRKQIEEKPFIPASWSVTDTTTENLLLTKNRISGEL